MDLGGQAMDITKVVLSELKEIKLRLQHKIKKMKFEFYGGGNGKRLAFCNR